MKYELVSEDEKCFVVKDSKGESFKVAKKGLTQKMAAKIASLAPVNMGMADGGIVPSPAEAIINQFDPMMSTAPTKEPSLLQERIAALQNTPIPTKAERELALAQPEIAVQPPIEENVVPVESPAAPIMPQQNFAKTYNNLIGQQQGAIQDIGKAQSEQAQAQTQILSDFEKQQQEFMKDFEARRKPLEEERMRLEKEISDTKIDPKRYWSNLSTGNKISANIALILGGIGGALTGEGGNVALNILNKNIENDIMAQKEELGKKNNLLAQNLRKFGDLREAEQATRMQLSTIVDTQLKKAAAQSGSKIAMSNAQMASAQLKAQSLDAQSKLAQTQALNDVVRKQGGLTEEAIPLLSKEQKETLVRLPDGKYGFAKTKEAAQKVDEYMRETGTVTPQLKYIKDRLNDPNFSKFSLEDRADIEARLNTLVGSLRVPITGPGPMTEAERKFIVDTLADPRKIFSLKSSETAKINAILNNVDMKTRQQYAQAGVKLPSLEQERANKIKTLQSRMK